jgi:uncharacterized protein (DUF305 family)
MVNYKKSATTKVSLNTVLLIIITVLVAILVGFFAQNRMNNTMDMGMGMQDNYSANYSNQETMFAMMMIPHHEQAVTMSDLALANSTNPAVLDLAARIKAEQAPEILQMKSWLNVGNSMMDHDMNMSGMLTKDDLAKLGSLKDKEFDTMFLTAMIEHHEGAIEMTKMIQDSSNPEVKTLAENIITSQTKEIAEMKELLTKLA